MTLRRRGFLLAEGSGCCPRSELPLERELVLPWGIVRIGLRNASEGRVAEACAAAAVSDVEVGCVGDIEAFYAELHVDTFRDRKVLEEGEIDVTKVRSEQRIALSSPDRSEGLRGELCRVKEVRKGFVAQPSISNLVGTILPSAVLEGSHDC